MSSLVSHLDLIVPPEKATHTHSTGPDTTSNAGTFAYATNSAFQRSIYQKCEPYVPDLKGLKTITVVDYGCGPGRNWTYGLNLLLSRADEDIQYQLVLNDGMKTDWKEVAQVVQDYRAGQCGRQIGHFAVLPGTFYDQIMPDRTVDIGMAWSSFHWLERTPPPMDIQPNEDYYTAWQANIRSQGLEDLTKLLCLRAREIKPGGHLLVVIPTTPASSVKVYWEAFLEAFKRCLKDGTITPEQWRAFRAPFFQPTEDDLRQILTTVRDLWHLPIPWAYHTLAHPAWKTLQDSEKTQQDYEEYVDGIAGFFMALIRDVLVRALRGGEGINLECPAANEQSILQQVTTRFREAVLSEELRNKRPESCWLAMRLVRKHGVNILEAKANL
ncbi:hypothetical protein DPSP01_010487 [Paraphaeosphaeria sporulosa]|uniref:S-adenosyl-L-methionine-dependent methyltransferase n=1 Tax=Paraphaeosphaeria sporulosa TaxID=1460663 RepID=A0A177BZN0_9PLEO|nr:S-adenosyl-L-methionine-dependent methyltransferase [Paraphaeosphaeria sporulosa]OAF99896.1 S-adenosyl-L-methionine-dependent methyltransferase [Paraphaeosphaeria sporulosa]